MKHRSGFVSNSSSSSFIIDIFVAGDACEWPRPPEPIRDPNEDHGYHTYYQATDRGEDMSREEFIAVLDSFGGTGLLAFTIYADKGNQWTGIFPVRWNGSAYVAPHECWFDDELGYAPVENTEVEPKATAIEIVEAVDHYINTH